MSPNLNKPLPHLPSSAHSAAGMSSRASTASFVTARQPVSSDKGEQKHAKKDEQNRDNFDPQAAGHHTALATFPKASPQGGVKDPAHASEHGMRAASQQKTKSVAGKEGSDASKKNSFVGKLKSLFSNVTRNNNKVFIGCLIGGFVLCAAGLLMGDPFTTFIGISLIVAGAVGLAQRDRRPEHSGPAQGTKAPPAMPNNMPKDMQAEGDKEERLKEEAYHAHQIEKAQASDRMNDYINNVESVPLDEVAAQRARLEEFNRLRDAKMQSDNKSDAASLSGHSMLSEENLAHHTRALADAEAASRAPSAAAEQPAPSVSDLYLDEPVAARAAESAAPANAANNRDH